MFLFEVGPGRDARIPAVGRRWEALWVSGGGGPARQRPPGMPSGAPSPQGMAPRREPGASGACHRPAPLDEKGASDVMRCAARDTLFVASGLIAIVILGLALASALQTVVLCYNLGETYCLVAFRGGGVALGTISLELPPIPTDLGLPPGLVPGHRRAMVYGREVCYLNSRDRMPPPQWEFLGLSYASGTWPGVYDDDRQRVREVSISAFYLVTCLCLLPLGLFARRRWLTRWSAPQTQARSAAPVGIRPAGGSLGTAAQDRRGDCVRSPWSSYALSSSARATAR